MKKSRSAPSESAVETAEDAVPAVRTAWRNLPVVAVVGRPNVGKSTLFNRLLRKRKAIVDPTPGVTRDPIESTCMLRSIEKPITLVDTGGYKLDREVLDDQVVAKSLSWLEKADLILFLVDVAKMAPEDEEFAAVLRRHAEKVVLVGNKADSPERDPWIFEYARFGFSGMVAVSAEHGRGLDELEALLLARLDFSKAEEYPDEHDDVRVAIMGKPNVGKSTLLNRLVGAEKSIVSDIPGTTRDVVEGSFVWKGKPFTVLDTAGIRRKKKVFEAVEYYSVNRAIKAIDECDVVILMIDAQEGLSDQDKKIAALAEDKGRGIIFALNKWDAVPEVKNGFEAARDKLRYFFGQMAFAPVLAVSAKTGEGVPKLLDMAAQVFSQLNQKIETSKLNKKVEEWVEAYPPPVATRTKFKVRYATQLSVNPQRFAFFVSRPEAVLDSYATYLRNRMREDLGMALIPLRLEIRASRTKWEERGAKDERP